MFLGVQSLGGGELNAVVLRLVDGIKKEFIIVVELSCGDVEAVRAMRFDDYEKQTKAEMRQSLSTLTMSTG